MKSYQHISDDGFEFCINIFWSEDRGILRIESGPREDPREMVAQFEGLSKCGAKATIQLWLLQMIDGGHEIDPVLEALNLPA